MTGTVLIAGALAQRPNRGGHAWVFLNWMLGFRRCGYRTIFVDRFDRSMGDVGAGVGWVRDVMGCCGFSDNWSVVLDDGTTAGITRDALERCAVGAVLLNVMGYLDDEVLLGTVGRRIFLDVDPGFGQSWQQAQLAELFVGHDAYATVGLNVGRPDCLVPTLGIPWITTLPPVDLDAWPVVESWNTCFSTVGSWRGPFAPVQVGSNTFGLRVHEARSYADLPSKTGAWLEAALDIDETDDRDRALLLNGGWRLRDPRREAGTVETYRSYVQNSFAEFAIAKHIYVRMRSGWFSDRSACYLAAGKAVVVSDTGVADHLPVGEGLLTYTDLDEAAEAIHEVEAHGSKHAAAARRLAEDLFDAGTVAQRLLERAA